MANISLDKQKLLEYLITQFANTPYGAVSAKIKEIYNKIKSDEFDLVTPLISPEQRERRYFTDQQLSDLAKEIKTIPVDADGHALPLEYDDHYVRSTVLKLISDNRLMQEYIATVINGYHHILPYNLTQVGVYLVKGDEPNESNG